MEEREREKPATMNLPLNGLIQFLPRDRVSAWQKHPNYEFKSAPYYIYYLRAARAVVYEILLFYARIHLPHYTSFFLLLRTRGGV